MLEWALRYIQLGWPVFPLAVRSKLPMIAGGRGVLEATLNEPQVREWWTRWPAANIGLATGHGWFVVDVDIKKDGDETWDNLRAQYAALPSTIEQVTGAGGRHILFLEPPDFKVQNSVEKLGPGLDVRGHGGYIVACPSVHPQTGRAYGWDGLQDIEEQKIAPAPAWLLKLLRDGEQRKPATSDAGLPKQITAGTRNDTIFRKACWLRRKGWSESEILVSIRALNQARCVPPLEERELATIAASAARYKPAHAPGNASLNGELPVTPTDVEAAAAAVMANNDMKGAFDMAPNVARLLPSARALITGKFRAHFGSDFSVRLFEQALGVKNATSAPSDEPPDDGGAPGGEEWPNLKNLPQTDSGNGERIVLMFRDDIRYCVEMRSWLVWDGRRWEKDESGKTTQLAKRMCRELYRQALGNDVLSKFARKSENQSGIAAALSRAATEHGIAISAKELDQQPYLLNCLNGVVDLTTGELLPHDRGFMITKICRHNYNKDAECPRFLGFLQWAMGQNPEAELGERTVRMLAFLQRAFGYSLTADVSEKCVFICYGHKGNNGKTTLLTVFLPLLGEYSAQISIDTLMTQRGYGDAALRADMADLRGARMVTTSEVEEQHKLSEGKLKYITAGAGDIKSCRKYENPISFPDNHKLWMDCNHRPKVTGTDDAIWSRLKCVPFEVRIERDDPEFDLKLGEKLQAESEGILAWAVRGAVRWKENGLGDPPEIGQASVEWREHDDPLKEFLEDCCEIDADAWCPSAKLSAAYTWWCKQEHERFPLGRENFGERIRAKGFVPSRSRRTTEGKQLRTIEGLRLKDEVLSHLTPAPDTWRRSVSE